MPDDYDIDISPDDDQALAAIQAEAARAASPELDGIVVADDDRKVELLGRKFRIADKVGLMPLLKFASAQDLKTDDPRGLSALYSMLRDCIHPGSPGCGQCAACTAGDEVSCKAWDKGDWADFEQHAIDTKADGEELFAVVQKVLAVVSGRPTNPPSTSSPGPRATRRSLTGTSSGGRAKGSRR